jgi:hypothetical protein
MSATGTRERGVGMISTLALPIAVLCVAFAAVAAEPGPTAPVPPDAAAAVATDDPVVIDKDGVVLRRSEIEAALRSLPPEYCDKPLDQLVPVIVGQRLYDRDGPLDALRD